jgi:hypothetical protein
MAKRRAYIPQKSPRGDASRRPFERARVNELDREYRRFRDGVERLLRKRLPFPFAEGPAGYNS